MKSKKINNYLNNNINFNSGVYDFHEVVTVDSVHKAIRGIELLHEEGITDFTPLVKISSYGGDPYAALYFYDAIKDLQMEVHTLACGPVMSAALIMFLAGKERFMHENATLMAHTISSEVEGKFHDVKTEYEECDKLLDASIKIYSKHSNITQKTWHKRIEHKDYYIRKAEALKLGLCTNEN